jgi:hypothetical protein
VAKLVLIRILKQQELQKAPAKIIPGLIRQINLKRAKPSKGGDAKFPV